MNVEIIRDILIRKLADGKFVKDKSGVKMIEIIGANFLADAPAIFGEPNQEYIQRELEWYKSMS